MQRRAPSPTTTLTTRLHGPARLTLAAGLLWAAVASPGCSPATDPGDRASVRLELTFAPSHPAERPRAGPYAAPSLPDSARVTIDVFFPDDEEVPSRQEVHLVRPDVPALRATLDDLPPGVRLDFDVLVEKIVFDADVSGAIFTPLFEGRAGGVLLEPEGTNRVRVPLVLIGKALLFLLGIDEANVRMAPPRPDEPPRGIVPVFLSHSDPFSVLTFDLYFKGEQMWPESVVLNPILAGNPNIGWNWFVAGGEKQLMGAEGVERTQSDLLPLHLEIFDKVWNDDLVPIPDGPLFEIYFSSTAAPTEVTLTFDKVFGNDSGENLFSAYVIEPAFTFPVP